MSFDDVIELVKTKVVFTAFTTSAESFPRNDIKKMIIEEFEKLGFKIYEDEILNEEYDGYGLYVNFDLEIQPKNNEDYNSRDYYNQDYPELDF